MKEFEKWKSFSEEERFKLKLELSELENKLGTKTAELESSCEQLKKVETELLRIDCLVKERNHTNERCGALKKEMNLLQERMSELESHHQKALVEIKHKNQAEANRIRVKFEQQKGSLEMALNATRQQLEHSLKDLKRIRKRANGEINELESVAEDQCRRSAGLTDQLIVVKRRYAQLRSQISTYGVLMDEMFTIASNDKMDGREGRLHQALAHVQCELRRDLGMIVDNELSMDLRKSRSPSSRGRLTSSRAQIFEEEEQSNGRIQINTKIADVHASSTSASSGGNYEDEESHFRTDPQLSAKIAAWNSISVEDQDNCILRAHKSLKVPVKNRNSETEAYSNSKSSNSTGSSLGLHNSSGLGSSIGNSSHLQQITESDWHKKKKQSKTRDSPRALDYPERPQDLIDTELKGKLEEALNELVKAFETVKNKLLPVPKDLSFKLMNSFGETMSRFADNIVKMSTSTKP
ncbi:hypothetical protein Ciccas_001234, partial [Cichlidogyrus casuarinus]